MEQTVVHIKDIEEVYGKDWQLSEGLGARGARTKKVAIGFMEDEVPVMILSSLGPYVTLKLECINQVMDPHFQFIMPKDKVVKKELKPAVERFTPILDKYLPGRWFSDRTKLYMHYPELELTNSLGMKHTIYDLVVWTEITSTGALSSLYGKRFSFSPEEIVCGYSHSHLSAVEYPDSVFSSFCQGSNTPFDKMMKSLYKYNSDKEFELFLMQLEDYLKWESLEGRPHISMTDIGSAAGGDGRGTNYTEDQVHNVAMRILEIMSENPTSQIIVNNGYQNVIDPSMNPKWFYENVEKVILAEYSQYPTVGWDEMHQKYVRSGSRGGGSYEPINVTSTIDKLLVEKLKITPRVIETKTTVEQKISYRMGINNIQTVLDRVNKYMFTGRNTIISNV
jgi:hypothetical protein